MPQPLLITDLIAIAGYNLVEMKYERKAHDSVHAALASDDILFTTLVGGKMFIFWASLYAIFYTLEDLEMASVVPHGSLHFHYCPLVKKVTI
nr:hypothetical protein CFP56_61418 [Quercus suber]